MPSLYPAPNEHDVEVVLAALVSTPTHVARLQSAEPDREPTGIMVEYVGVDDSLAAIAFADHDIVNFMGGAIAAVDVAAVQESNNGSKLHSAAVESFREVANGLGSSLNGDYTPELRLANVHQLPGELSEEIKQLWRKPRGKRGYRVTVDEYGSGTLILYLS
ncbi:MAG TPA: hypothetical protein VGP92_04860 [Acidimicrobiia bacterium]|jgi:hypothetical protein|nr:hypothetical protein [Acidimicrobiia bacterium]